MKLIMKIDQCPVQNSISLVMKKERNLGDIFWELEHNIGVVPHPPTRPGATWPRKEIRSEGGPTSRPPTTTPTTSKGFQNKRHVASELPQDSSTHIIKWYWKIINLYYLTLLILRSFNFTVSHFKNQILLKQWHTP